MQSVAEGKELREAGDFLASALSILIGVAITLVVRGYQFGGSNHNVYLLEPLRQSSPPLLAHDWFTTQTLQYHGVFNHLCVGLMRLHILEPAFLVGYLGLLVLLHAAWLKWVKAVGGTRQIYLISVLLFYLSAGGLGLGMYDFLQDNSFLPSNIASVLMLWGLCLWVTGSRPWAGLLLGVAGLFHLNYALVGIGLWGALALWDGMRLALQQRGWWIGTVALLALCIPNIWPAVTTAISQQHPMPLAEFVSLYVRLRHPHHYDPSSWPLALWVSFLWPFPLAVLAALRMVVTPERQETCRLFALFCGLLIVALVGAGVWYVSEPLIQMSLFRFSVYVKLLTCIGAAMALSEMVLIRERLFGLLGGLAIVIAAIPLVITRGSAASFVHANVWALELFAGLCLAVAAYRGLERARWLVLLGVLCVGFAWRHFGLNALPDTTDSADYLALCDWAREHTPVDAIFLVPPREQSFRLHAERAIVVNFKCVPQLSGELGEWRDRLQAVLDLPDLRALPHRFDLALAAIGSRYDALGAAQLELAAKRYDASYIVTEHALDGIHGQLVFENHSCRLYALDH